MDGFTPSPITSDRTHTTSVFIARKSFPGSLSSLEVVTYALKVNIASSSGVTTIFIVSRSLVAIVPSSQVTSFPTVEAPIPLLLVIYFTSIPVGSVQRTTASLAS